MKKRLPHIDILKTLGILLILLAHVDPPKFLFEIRNFDVILLIMISGYLGLLTYKDKEPIINYFRKRLIRLVVPTWVFLAAFFTINTVLTLTPVDLKKIIESFTFANGIGYVWIIRIYLIVAILIPLVKYLVNKKRKAAVLGSSILLLLMNELLCHFGVFNNNIIQYLLAYFIPCYFIVVISYYTLNSDKKELLRYLFVELILFFSISAYLYTTNGAFVSTQDYKYPFRLYYISYGLMCSTLLILTLKNDSLCNKLNNKLTSFISKNSLWLYLWHILVIYILNALNINWLVKYVILLIISCLITYIQSILVNKKNGHQNRTTMPD